MSLVSEQTLHGKVDCRHGINEEALFAACVDANWSNASASDLVDGIAKAINSASDYLGLVEYRDVGPKWHWNISKMSKGRNTVIEILQQSGLSTRLDTMKIQSISHVIQSFSKCKSTEISEWVKTKFLELLTQVSDCDTEGSFRERKDAGLSLIFAFGTLLLLDQLGVHQLSYSPVPIASLEAPYAKLLVSMMVNMNDTEILAKSTPLGVGLLRVCSNKTSADPGHSLFSNRMLLRGVGHGESLRMHAAQQVSISIAETLQDEATTPSFTKRFASDLWMNDTIVHMETNLDDTTGESLAFAISLLLDNGAIDAFVTPIVMKKGRPAHTLHCLCKDETKDGSAKVKKLLELIFRHTTTLGIRIYDDMPRAKLCRSTVTVQTPYVDTSRGGKVDVKVSSFRTGEVIAAKAEFDHCKDIAMETGIPLSLVSDHALKIARKEHQSSRTETTGL
ncbi:unnamed protein product [Cylindrotheca closterium]|uniref:Uncharacterized protein n=1 Tax=Cylindrotheca closterium TaxID=2856 RepID=A0AAD2FI12_9STRA|nr:unnamed protein product [Cylindrotheca closterium]